MRMTYQTFWDAVKAVIKGKFIYHYGPISKNEKSQVNNLTLHLKDLEKEKQKQPKVSRRKKIIKLEQN